MRHITALLLLLLTATGALAQVPRRATNADIIAALLNPPTSGVIATLPSAVIPFGTATGTVADGGLLANLFHQPVTFGSTVTLAADPTAALQAATKQYVDEHAGSGNGGLVIGTTTGTAGDGGVLAATLATTNANTTNIAAFGTLAALRSNNLSDLASAATARTNLGVAYGTGPGTVAQGNDARIIGTPVAVTAAGTTQGGAAPLAGQFNLVTTSTGNTAVSLQAAVGEQNISNVGTVAAAIFPLPGSGSINGLANTASVSLPVGTSATVRSIDGVNFKVTLPIGIVPSTTVASSGAQTIALPLHGMATQIITMSANTPITITGGTAGERVAIELWIYQGGSGGFSPSFTNVSKWNTGGGGTPTFNTTAGQFDIVTIISADGTVSNLAGNI